MAVPVNFRQGPGGFYDVTDGSGPYAIDADGNATLIGSGGGGGPSGGLTDAQFAAITGRPADVDLAASPTDPNATMLSLMRAMMSQNAALLNLTANIVTELEAINANTAGG